MTDWRRLTLGGLLAPLWPSRPTAYLGPAPTPDGALFPRQGAVRLGGAAARQQSQVTCGATVGLLLSAAYDPALLAWLRTGERPGRLPPELLDVAEPDEPDATARLRAAQESAHRAATRALPPWPRALGTPPWGLARIARLPGHRWRARPVDDLGAGRAGALETIRAATAAGLPVPLYTGSELGGGPAAAVPRHVVLALPDPEDGRVRVYEPGGGLVHRVPLAGLGGGGAQAALGGWSRVVWLLEPVARP